MSNAWRAVAAVLTTLLLAAAASLGATVLFGVAASADVPELVAPNITNPQFVRLQIDAISPSTVTSATTGPLTVRGLLVNDGDREVRNLQVRLERAPVVQSATELRAALRSSPAELATQSPFVTFAPQLSPGQSAPFSLTLPLIGDQNTTLGLTQPGVYPMLVNVNGVPDYGDRARLDQEHFLLPVLSLPPSPNAASAGEQANTGPKPAPTAPPAFTVLWPLADRPRLLPSALGAPALLSDDELATSFADGGRLDGLLKAVEQRTRPSEDPIGALATSLCLGIDPDLLVTAQAMARGYQVAGADSRTTPGTGAAAAAAWLERLKALAKGRCVVALPWAQADLNALARASLPEFQTTALTAGPELVARTLALPPLPNVAWPPGNLLAERTATDVAALGVQTVLLSADGVATASGSPLPASARTARLPASASANPAQLGAALLDAPAASALTAMGSDQRPLRLQDALGAVAWPAIGGARTASTESGRASSAPNSVVLAPPQAWQIDAADAQTLLAEISALLQAGAATARSLPAVLDAVNSTSTRAVLDYPVQASASEVPTSRTGAIADAATDIREFGRSLKQDPQSGVSPNDLLAPLQLGLLRAASATTAEHPAGAGEAQVSAVRGELIGLRNGVSLQAPGGTYTLASAQSPLLLVVRNDLPVAVDVQLTVDGSPGLRATDIGIQQLPARSGRQLQVPTTVSRTGQFAIDVFLTTDTDQRLGAPARLQVRSTAYGTATALATASAAALLLALVARRLWHRFRGQPDRADEGRVTP